MNSIIIVLIIILYGIVRVPIPKDIISNLKFWAMEFSYPTLDNVTFESDGEYAFYRNILNESNNFPFESFHHFYSKLFSTYFIANNNNEEEDMELDDAFCIHYNAQTQLDTTCSRHMDPSDITVNMCLERSSDCEGSAVVFFGTQELSFYNNNNNNKNNNNSNDTTTTTEKEENEEEESLEKEEKEVESFVYPEIKPYYHHDDNDNNDDNPHKEFAFVVDQIPGVATIHWGCHPHETLPLLRGTRTNIILTYRYKDRTRSDLSMRTCYATTTS